MDIVDAQVHANVLGTEATLAVMDALGIQGLLFDEYQTTTEDGAPQPGYRLADGAFRPVGPNAEAAALRHPQRFAFLMRVDLRDLGIEGCIETLAAAPGFKALGTLVFTPSEGAVFADGGCEAGAASGVLRQDGRQGVLGESSPRRSPIFSRCLSRPRASDPIPKA
jgi:L-fuconolactonase